MATPRVTVLTPTYNQSAYVGRCVESVLAQTFQDWELIVIDDGSSDDTAEKVRSYRDERIVLIEAAHRGIESLSDTYSLGLARARGELIALLDGDDYWLTDKLEIQTALFSDSRVALTYSAVHLCDSKGRITGTRSLPRFARGLNSGNSIVLKILLNSYFPYSVTSMVRRSVLARCGGFIQPRGLPLVDVPTWLNVLLEGSAFGHSRPLGVYRVHADSVTRRRSDEVVRGQQAYNLSFLQQNWAALGLSELQFRTKAKQLDGYHRYVQGVSKLRGRQSGAARDLIFSLRHSDFPRKAKTLLWLASAALHGAIA